ncbi:nif11-like leader peptide domain protein [Synechococcus sp. BIOS-E4-1]|uniref:Nif11-like leader peptide family RiPP precursor n=1 Tax=Synechococcus sp. BIOS-E4-1 TaxID=1400864 RepID=UPI0016484262|nr:Nif11-like leader peptide family RiPP precursor [Synechococcus sp. BIOS-E4-1]QNI54872.1 nif11-like leader peptide domain protein [Synechococcus sp. BIOS-E4-1]
MTQGQLETFLKKVKADTSLQEKLKKAADADAVVAIAKNVGLTIFADDLKKGQSELANEELEKVAGGEQCPLNTGCPLHTGWWCTGVLVDQRPHRSGASDA